MKLNLNLSSSRRKQRKAYFTAPSNIRRHLLSAKLCKELKNKHGQVRSIPIRKDDEVKILRGKFKDEVGKVISVYRKKMCIHVERVIKERANGSQTQVPIHPSNCEITKLKLDRNRKSLIQKKKNGRQFRSKVNNQQ